MKFKVKYYVFCLYFFSFLTNKGGKFIFGISLIRSDGAVLLPVQAIEEYAIAKEGLSASAKEVFARIRKDLGLPENENI